jgi:hypothetical protein
MMEVKNFQECLQLNSALQHNCKQNLVIIKETHSVNNPHNIVIARKLKCKVCNKIFEQYDPKGLDKIF